MEDWSVHHLVEAATARFGRETAASIGRCAQKLIDNNVPVIFSLKHLSKIINAPQDLLTNTVRRRRESANYRMFAITKRSGGKRYIHVPCSELYKVQKFINDQILQSVPPHHSSFAFNANGGIYRCAALHCKARWLFQFDLKDFFYSINESAVYKIFLELGYSKLLAFEFARLCTTYHVPKSTKLLTIKRQINTPPLAYPMSHKIRHLGVLPQGAPSSPMLSNLAAKLLDIELNKIAKKFGMIYTRYADDICFSAYELPKNFGIGKIKHFIITAIRKHGFEINNQKTHIAGPGSKKLVLGLLVDGEKPRISREMQKRIDRLIHAVVKYGPYETAQHEGFESIFGFQNHLWGLMAYIRSIDKQLWGKFNQKLATVTWISAD